MAFRRPSYRPSRKPSSRKFHVADTLPIWTPAHSDTANLVFLSALERFGITDISSYWHRLRGWAIASVILCILVGASNNGLKGAVLGGLLGFAAPALLIWLAVVVTLIAIFLAVYCLAWAVILWLAWWILHS